MPKPLHRLLTLALEPAAASSRAAWAGRLALLAALALWTWQFARMDHFHEAGHLLFRLFGNFMSVLGGSLLQLLIPLAVLVSFLRRQRAPFAASVGLWWFGQSLMDLAPYIHDAQAQRMLLIGGVTGGQAPGYHDWNNLLGRLGWLEAAPGLAALANGFGLTLMLTALAWGSYILYRHRDRT